MRTISEAAYEGILALAVEEAEDLLNDHSYTGADELHDDLFPRLVDRVDRDRTWSRVEAEEISSISYTVASDAGTGGILGLDAY